MQPFIRPFTRVLMDVSLDENGGWVIGPDTGGGGITIPSTWEQYIPWDTDLIYEGLNNLRKVIGTGFNIGFWIFIIITGIYLVLKLVDSIGH